jgi:serine/threonine-protein kinase
MEVGCRVQAGNVIAGKFRVDRVLGAGGMGVVFAAIQIDLDRPVALKFLQPAALQQLGLVQRFAREARAAARLKSEHVVRVLDVGTIEGAGPYIVMEYLEGEDFANLIASRGALPCAEAVDTVVQVCDALAEAHALGIVHRDLKPANLFATRRNNEERIVKVLDFGLSKCERPGDPSVTSGSGILGSPLYMSPEQLWSPGEVDGRSDIWSLGVILYELLTARAPFDGERTPELVTSILHRSPRPIENFRTDVPEELAAAVYRCLEKAPARRFADAAQLAGTLAPFGSGESRRIAALIPRAYSARAIAPPSAATPEADESVAPDLPATGAPTVRVDSRPEPAQSTLRSRRSKQWGARTWAALGIAAVSSVAVGWSVVGTRSVRVGTSSNAAAPSVSAKAASIAPAAPATTPNVAPQIADKPGDAAVGPRAARTRPRRQGIVPGRDALAPASPESPSKPSTNGAPASAAPSSDALTRLQRL